MNIIWQDAIYEDEKDWEESYKEYLSDKGMEESDMGIDSFISNAVDERWRDAQANLDIDIPEGILCFGTLSLWHGKRIGYDRRRSLSNISQCLWSYLGGYVKVYVDDGDLKAEETHHDGTNVYTYRAWKSGVTDEQKEEVLSAFSNGKENAFELADKYLAKLGSIVEALV